ncbi:hypothetical protein [Bifidobacterium cuniculi]|uniref:Uncharacterized protein n=1 Tax=Bifidobacterium cuniculi TaxID=1688 RepID=A0A087AYL6_9BIFI|nr:hypothetical protein [Bifidobacterium cuniculi]KFI63866.1 hypothetical protein BCUN_1478 [Bifidobacterium cuniculi]
MTDMTDKMKENFEQIKERIEEHKDDFGPMAEKVKGAVKGAKEGWESASVEDEDKQRIAHAEETHQTH